MPDYRLTIDNSNRKATFLSVSYLKFNHPDIVLLLDRADFMHALVPISEITFSRVDETLQYEYRIELEDGREWNQSIAYEDPEDNDPPMTFDVQDVWRLTEFSRQRDIREMLTKMRAEHGLNSAVIEFGEFS